MPDPSSSFTESCPLPRHIEFLLHTLQELSLVRTPAEMQRLVSYAARELTGCDGATFVLREQDHCYYVDENAISPLWKGQRIPLEQCVSGWSMQHREAVIIEDIYADSRVPAALYKPTFVKSMLVVPIRKRDPIGAIGNYWSQPHQPTAEEVHLLQTLADSASVVMENVQVYQELDQRVKQRTEQLEQALEQIQRLSITDELTNLYNRRGFRLLAGQVLRRIYRTQEPFVLVYLDVDGLKQVNDEYGHRRGDEMLADMAEVMRLTFRDSDILARVGGDEFCVLALGPPEHQQDLRYRLDAALEHFNQHTDQPYRLSCSLGILPGPLEQPMPIDDLISIADDRMYQEKNAKHSQAIVSNRA